MKRIQMRKSKRLLPLPKFPCFLAWVLQTLHPNTLNCSPQNDQADCNQNQGLLEEFFRYTWTIINQVALIL